MSIPSGHVRKDELELVGMLLRRLARSARDVADAILADQRAQVREKRMRRQAPLRAVVADRIL